MLINLASAQAMEVAASIVVGAILCISMSGCEDSKSRPGESAASASLRSPSGAGVNADRKPTTDAEVIVLRFKGPSDRPSPVLVVASSDAASKQALEDLSKVEPAGGTPVRVEPGEFRELLASIGASAGQPVVLELEVCGTAPRRVQLGSTAGEEWLRTAEERLAPAAAARGYLRSLRETVSRAR